MISHERSNGPTERERLLSVDLNTNNLTINQYSRPIDEPNIVVFGKTFNITKKQLSVVSLLSIFYFLSNAYYSLMAPFLPSEALKKGISQTQVGVIFGVYELVVLILSPIFGKYVIKFFFVYSIL